MVIILADDPSTFSSQNEQDTRNFIKTNKIFNFRTIQSTGSKRHDGLCL